MDGERITGTYSVVQSTDPFIRRGVDVSFAITPDGLQVQVHGAATYEIPWQDARVNVASLGQVAVESGRGTMWCDPGAAADPREFAEVFGANGLRSRSDTPYEEFPAGAGQVLVLYRGVDDGTEVDPSRLLAAIAADAGIRHADGWRMVSMVGLPLRNGGQAFGISGSAFVTKAAIGCLYVQDGPAAVETN